MITNCPGPDSDETPNNPDGGQQFSGRKGPKRSRKDGPEGPEAEHHLHRYLVPLLYPIDEDRAGAPGEEGDEAKR